MIKVKILYIVILLEILLLNVMYVRFWPLWLLIMALLIPVCLKVCQLIVSKGMEVRFVCDDETVYKGVRANICINIKTGKMPLAHRVKIKYRYKFSYEDEIKRESLDAFLTGGELNMEIFKECDHIGVLNMEIEKVYVYDMIYLFSKKIPCKSSLVRINVVPRHYQNTGIKGINIVKDMIDSDKFSDKKSGDDPSEVFDIREYKAGDRLNSIHWKLTSKTDTLMVKEFSLPINDNDVIIFDNHRCDMQKMDMMYEGLISLVYLMLLNEREIHVICLAGDGVESFEISGYEDVDIFMGEIIAKPPVKNKDILELTDFTYKGKVNGNIYFITERYDINKTYANISYVLAADAKHLSEQIIELRDWIIYE